METRGARLRALLPRSTRLRESPRAALLALLLFTAAPAAVATICPGSAPPPGDSPPEALGAVLRVPEPKFEWGRVLAGTLITHHFEIHNDGDEALQIPRVSLSCGCLKETHDRVIPPRGSGRLTITVETKALLGEPIEQSATLLTSDRRRSRFTVTLRGAVDPLVITSPSPLQLRAYPGEPLLLDATLRPAPGLAVEAIRVRAEKNRVSVRIEEVEPGKSYRLRLEASSPKAPGTLPERLMVTVKSPGGEERNMVLPVAVMVRHRVEIDPPRTLTFSRRETAPLLESPPRPVEKAVSLRTEAPGFRFRVLETRIEGGPPGVIEAGLTTEEEGRRYRVDVRLTKPAPGAPAFRGLLVIVTDDPVRPQRRVAIRAFVGP